MAEYTVQLSGDDEQALAYAQEVYARTWSPEVEEGQEPSPAPTLAQMPTVLVAADLANRLREMQATATTVVSVLQGITDPTVREQVLQSLVPSPALRAYVQSKL